jgi:hypothetical protein
VVAGAVVRGGGGVAVRVTGGGIVALTTGGVIELVAGGLAGTGLGVARTIEDDVADFAGVVVTSASGVVARGGAAGAACEVEVSMTTGTGGAGTGELALVEEVVAGVVAPVWSLVVSVNATMSRSTAPTAPPAHAASFFVLLNGAGRDEMANG